MRPTGRCRVELRCPGLAVIPWQTSPWNFSLWEKHMDILRSPLKINIESFWVSLLKASKRFFFFCVAGHCSHLPPGAESKLRCKKAQANPRVVRCFNLLPWLGVAAYHLDHLDLYWARYGKISDVRCPFPVDFWSVPHGTVVNPGDPWETLATQLRPGDPNTFQVRMTQGLQKH